MTSTSNFNNIPNYTGQITLKENLGQYTLHLPDRLSSNFDGYQQNLKNGPIPSAIDLLELKFVFKGGEELLREFQRIFDAGVATQDRGLHIDNFYKRIRAVQSNNNASILTIYERVKVQKKYRYPVLGKLPLKFLKVFNE